MKIVDRISRRHSILLQALFILIWLDNVIFVDRFLPLYLLWGLWGVLCLWQNQKLPVAQKGIRAAVWGSSAFLSLCTVLWNLAVFEPLTALLSISNMAMSLLGGAFASYHVLAGAVSYWKKKSAVDIRVLVRMAAVYLWLLVLIPTDSRYSVYVFCAVVGTLCICHNSGAGEMPEKKMRKALLLFAGSFSLAVVLANYPLFTPLFTGRTFFYCVAGLLGGICIGYHVLLAMMTRLPVNGRSELRQHPRWVFAAVFLPIAGICLLYLWSYCYPGILSRDSYSTVDQILGVEAYNNTMPFWHTITVQPFLRLGMQLLGSVDGGIALFHCVQLLFMAMCFGCVVVTLYQIGVPKWVLCMVFFAYACIPYNIVYSVSLWKDVPFAGSAVLLVTGLYRLLRSVGSSRKLNYAMLLLGMVGFSLMRTNGWYAFLVTVIVMVLLTKKKYGKLLLIMALVLLLCWVMINPVLDVLGVAETNLVEAFAVPMQQVARVVAEERPLTQEETELLSSIFWLDRMADLYEPLSVDPIKFLTFRYEQVGVITENPGAYLRLYFQLGLKYPGDYLKAWIDETKGFWNGGYDYWLYSLTDVPPASNPVASAFVSLFRFLNETEVLKLFASAGLYVWGMIGCCVVNMLKKREEFLLSIPMLVLVAGLWLGTPVFCEFRYAYPVVLTLPLIACVTIYGKAETN